jgi:hypothetical protein
MQDLIERERKSAAADTIPDRRRPGRLKYKNPHLITLLRRKPDADQRFSNTEPGAGLTDFKEVRERNDLSAAAGIALAVALGTVAWSSLVLALWLQFGR